MHGIKGSADIARNPGEDYLKAKGWRKRKGLKHVWRHPYFGIGYFQFEVAWRLQRLREGRQGV